MKNNFARAFSLLSQLGISMLVPIILCLFVGRWIDLKVGSSPLFLIIFIILGVGAAFRNMYVMVQNIFKD